MLPGDPNNPDHKLMRVPLAVEIVTGIRPAPSKCWRWYQLGIKGVKLETWLIGGSRLTCLAAVKAFIEQRTNPPQPKTRRKPKLAAATRNFVKRELGL